MFVGSYTFINSNKILTLHAYSGTTCLTKQKFDPITTKHVGISTDTDSFW